MIATSLPSLILTFNSLPIDSLFLRVFDTFSSNSCVFSHVNSYSLGDNNKYKQFDDDFEDFGYEVKNIRRQTKKKVAKFKREVNEYDDTF